MDFTAGLWSVYFYNGHLYASDMYDGLEVLRLTDPAFADAARYTATELNPGSQPEYAWVWRAAPLLPTDAAERAALTPLSLSPERVRPGASPTVEVALPAGSLEPGETVDIWWMPGAAVIATLTAADDGALPPTTVTVPGPLTAGSYDLVVDMEAVEFLDSTGLGVLVGGLKKVRAHDGSLSLICNQDRLLKIFRITGLAKVFIIHDSPEAALASA